MTTETENDDVQLCPASFVLGQPDQDGYRRVILADNGLAPRYQAGETVFTSPRMAACGDDVLILPVDGNPSIVRLVSVGSGELTACNVNGTGGIGTMPLAKINRVERVSGSIHPDMSQLPANMSFDDLPNTGQTEPAPTLH